MADSNFRAHYNMNGKTQCVDFSIPNDKICEESKKESARNLIKEKHPDFTGKNILISTMNSFKS